MPVGFLKDSTRKTNISKALIGMVKSFELFETWQYYFLISLCLQTCTQKEVAG